jgi:hypothetical protein
MLLYNILLHNMHMQMNSCGYESGNILMLLYGMHSSLRGIDLSDFAGVADRMDLFVEF